MFRTSLLPKLYAYILLLRHGHYSINAAISLWKMSCKAYNTISILFV